MSQNHQRGNRKGNTKLLFIKHNSKQFYLTNVSWEQKFILRNKRNNGKGQANQKTKSCKMNVSIYSVKTAACQDSESDQICIMSNNTKAYPCVPGTRPLGAPSARLCICPISVTELTFWVLTLLTCCSERENGECEALRRLIRKWFVRCFCVNLQPWNFRVYLNTSWYNTSIHQCHNVQCHYQRNI